MWPSIAAGLKVVNPFCTVRAHQRELVHEEIKRAVGQTPFLRARFAGQETAMVNRSGFVDVFLTCE